MKTFALYVAIATIVLMQSCTSTSSDVIKQLKQADKSTLNDFGIEADGEIIYQFYQQYGFTDLEEQLIVVLKPDNTDKLNKKLPISTTDKRKMRAIDAGKFKASSVLDLNAEKTAFADVRLVATEFTTGVIPSMQYAKGKYKLTTNDSVETIYIFDKQSGLLYIESKRMP